MIIHKQTNKVIVPKNKFLRNFMLQGIGLMFHIPISDTGYIFVFQKEKRIPITMLNVFFSLDILWLNSQKKVVYKYAAKPFELNINPKVHARYVVELQKGRAQHIRIGDILEF